MDNWKTWFDRHLYWRCTDGYGLKTGLKTGSVDNRRYDIYYLDLKEECN